MDDTWLCPQENPPKAAWRHRFPPHSKALRVLPRMSSQ